MDITNPLVAYDVKLGLMARLDCLIVEYYTTNSPKNVMTLDITMGAMIDIIKGTNTLIFISE